ncbi:hypothetical protein ABBQ32_009096 [Trebouxia sp. C0010 RCD-2024]
MDQQDDGSDVESEAYLGDDDGNVGPQDQEVADLDGAEADGGYESDSEEGQDEGEGQTEVTDDAVHCFKEHKDAVFAVAWNPAQADMVASGGGDDIAYIWRVRHEGLHTLKGHTDSVAALAFNSSGTLLASGSLDSRVSIWESSSGRCVHSLEGPGESVDWVAWHPRGDVILAGSEDFTAWMWNAQSGDMMQVFYGHTGAVRCGRFTPDGKTIVTGGGEGDATLKVWDPKTGSCTGTIQGHGFHTAGLTSLDISADSTVVITGSEDMTAKISNLHTGKVLGTFQGHTDSVEAVALSAALPVAATASIDGKVLIWDNATLSVRGTCEHPEAVVALCCHPSQPLIFTGCLDGAVRCWDLRTGVCIQTRTGNTKGIQSVALSPDASMVLAGSDDMTARVYGFHNA